MRKMGKTPFAVILILVLNSLVKLNAQQIPELRSEDFAQLTITSNTVYDGNALWGYMNGGADLYLEYGFTGLRVQEVELGEEKLKLEIFRMSSPKAAFGIMSIKRFKCTEENLLIAGDCLMPYQYQAAKSNYYISIINYSGKDVAVELTRILARMVLGKIEGMAFSVPAFDNVDQQFVNRLNVKLSTGPLGLQNAVSKWSRLFEGFSGYDLYYLPVTIENGKIFFADIFFGDKQQADEFVTRTFSEPANYPRFKQTGNKTLGIRQVSETSYRLVEFAGEIRSFDPLAREFGF